MGLLLTIALAVAAPPAAGGEFVAETPAGPVAGGVPLVAADGALTLRTPAGPARLAPGAWLALRRAGAPLPAWPGGPHAALTSGDRVAGRALGGDARVLRFAPTFAPDVEPWAVPLTAVATVWVAPPRAESEAEALAPPWAAPKADTLRSAAGQVSGRLASLRSLPPGVAFRPAGAAALEVPLAEVRALTLDPTLARAPKLRGPHLRVVLADGSRLTLRTWELTADQLTGRAAFGVEVRVPASGVVALEPLGAAVELANLTPTVVAEGYAGRAAPWRAHRAAGGGALKLRESGGVSTYDGGLGVPARTRLTFALPPGATDFSARVGVDPAQARPGSVRVGLELDGRPLPGGGTIAATDEPLTFRADVRGGRALTLVTDFAPGGVGAVANWVMPKVVIQPGQ